VKELCSHLGEIQNAFIALLADPKSKHLSRESCCLGLAACRGLADVVRPDEAIEKRSDELNEKLLRAFGQTQNYGGSAMMETRAQAEERRRANGANNQDANPSTLMEPFGTEPEEGGASGLGEAALGAYREMAAAAVSLGRPDVLYALLMLSVSYPVWFSTGARETYGASALLGENSIIGGSRSNTAEMREALRPHLGKLLPRMLRACHDPNKQTREQMSYLWNGITGGGAEARLAITQHLLPTLDTLIEDASSKLWRARVGACGALSQIIVARSWKELGGGPAILDDDEVLGRTATSNTPAGARLLRLWRVAIRALDDVRGAVRESGEVLGRGVRGLTIRLCDPLATDKPNGSTITREDRADHERDASAAAATTLRWLLKHGLNQPSAEATGVCISCLVGIVDVVKPLILQPLLPELLRSLLFAMSGLEPAALNNLQVRAAGQGVNEGSSYDRLETLRLQMAQSGPLANACTKCLAMLPGVNLETQRAVIPQLNDALRLSAGFASRAATADAVSTLCRTCPDAFKFSGSASTNPSVSLLRALYFASEREHGQAAKDKMAHALGNIAALCPGLSVRQVALRACVSYNSSTGNMDDPAARRAAAAALRSIAVRASNQFSDGGNSDVWCRRVLPVAFLGMKDSDSKVAALWKEVWEEGGSSANLAGAADDFGSLLEEKLLPYLVKECLKALGDVSWSRRVTGSVSLSELANLNVLSPAPRSGKAAKAMTSFADAERARRRAQASSQALAASVKLLSGSRLWSGKADVVKASVNMASKWSEYLCQDDVDEHDLFGMEIKNGPCPWKPITVSPGEFDKDLFVGDSFFAGESEIDQDAQETSGSTQAMEVDEDGEDVKIDFEEGDRLLDDENQMTENDDDAIAEEKSTIVTFTGLCRSLVAQAFPASAKSMLSVAEDEILPYRATVLQAFNDLVTSLGDFPASNAQKKHLYQLLAPHLISVFDSEGRFNLDTKKTSDEPPLIVARSIDCLAACFWDGIGDSGEPPTSNILDLAKLLQTSGGPGQPAWTVREAAALGCASLASNCYSEALRNHQTITTMVDCVSQAQKDRKFWRVRLAGLKLLRALVLRAGNATDNSISGTVQQTPEARDRQLVLESLLPQKEKMLKLARQALSDSEAQVTALSSMILSAMAWWP
jgi:proteasome component ECM29